MTVNYTTLVLDLYDGSGNHVTKGTAQLVPSVQLTDVADEMLIVPAPVPAAFQVTGLPQVRLLDTDSEGPLPGGWAWTITFTGVPGSPAPFSFFLLHADDDEDGKQYLSGLTPVQGAVTMAGYLPLPSGGPPSAGEVPVAVGDGSEATAWGPGGTGGGAVDSVNGHAGVVVLAAADVGADPAGAAATAQSNAEAFATAAVATETGRAGAAEALLAPLASPALTGDPTAPTATAGTDTTQIATTAYADAAVAVETGRAEAAEALKLAKAGNLSDLASAATARANLGLGTAATQASTAFDAAGVAAAAQANAESFATAAVGTETTRAEAAEALALPLAGGTMSGPIAMGGNAVTGASDLALAGVAGATTPIRWVGGTVSGPPVTGTFSLADAAMDQAGAIWVCTTAGSAAPGNFTRAGLRAGEFDPTAFGAKGDGKVIGDAVMASTGSGVLTSATAGFTAADVGKPIMVNIGAANATTAPLCTTIASFQSATQVTLAANPAATAAGNPAIYGTDNTAALNATITAASAWAVAHARKARIMLGTGIYCLSSAPTKGNTGGGGPYYGNAILPIPVTDTSGASQKVVLEFQGTGAGDSPTYWEQTTPQVDGTALAVLEIAPATDGTWGIPSVIGGPTLASGTGFSFAGGFANIAVRVNDLKIITPYNPGWISIDTRFCAAAGGARVYCGAFAPSGVNGGNGPHLPVAGASWNFNGAGIRFPVMNNNDMADFDSLVIEGIADAIWIADHVTIRSLKCIYNANAIVVDNTTGSGSGALHGSWIGYASLETQTNNLIIMSGSKFSSFPLVIGLLDSENSSTPVDVTDTGILTGRVEWYNINSSQPKVSGSTRLKLVNNRLGAGLWASPPAVPATTVVVAAASMPWRDAMVNVQPGTATITAITVGGTALTGVLAGPVPVPSGSTIALTYTGGTPVWQWFLS